MPLTYKICYPCCRRPAAIRYGDPLTAMRPVVPLLGAGISQVLITKAATKEIARTTMLSATICGVRLHGQRYVVEAYATSEVNGRQRYQTNLGRK